MGSDLYTLLGLSVQLAKRVTTLDEYILSASISRSELLALRHHVLFLVKQGLQIVEMRLLPFTSDGQLGVLLQVEIALLRASLYHVLSVHHNTPESVEEHSPDTSVPTVTQTASALQSRSHEPSKHELPDAEATTSTIATDTSLFTNPWLLHPTHNPSTSATKLTTDIFHTSRLTSLSYSNQQNFLLPPSAYIPITSTYFTTATLAAATLPGSHPLRLAVAVAYTKFMTQCMGEAGRNEARAVAVKAVEDAWRAKEWGLGDEEFEEAVGCVRVLEAVGKESVGG